jgi:hypothetical protein
VTTEALKSHQQQYPHLDFRGGQVQCLLGQLRLKAAEDTLAPSDRWWTVDLYLDGLMPKLNLLTRTDPRFLDIAQIYGLNSPMNMQTKKLQPITKYTEKSASIR